MDNEDNKIGLENLVVVLKGDRTLFVDKELYEELQELPEDSLNRVYSALECDHTNKYKHVWRWLTCNDSRRNDRAHERMLLDYLDGNLEIKSRPEKKYKVYQSLGFDKDGDGHFTGLINSYGIITFTHEIGYHLNDSDFDSLTENQIMNFQADTGIELPESMWHEVGKEDK